MKRELKEAILSMPGRRCYYNLWHIHSIKRFTMPLLLSLWV